MSTPEFLEEFDALGDPAARLLTVGAIIAAFGGTSAFAQAIGLPDSHVRAMKARNSIPPDHWDWLVGAAIAKGIEGITFKLLAEIRSTTRRKSASSQAEASAA